MATVEQDIQNFQASGERNLAELKRILSEEKKVEEKTQDRLSELANILRKQYSDKLDDDLIVVKETITRGKGKDRQEYTRYRGMTTDEKLQRRKERGEETILDILKMGELPTALRNWRDASNWVKDSDDGVLANMVRHFLGDNSKNIEKRTERIEGRENIELEIQSLEKQKEFEALQKEKSSEAENLSSKPEKGLERNDNSNEKVVDNTVSLLSDIISSNNMDKEAIVKGESASDKENKAEELSLFNKQNAILQGIYDNTVRLLDSTNKLQILKETAPTKTQETTEDGSIIENLLDLASNGKVFKKGKSIAGKVLKKGKDILGKGVETVAKGASKVGSTISKVGDTVSNTNLKNIGGSVVNKFGNVVSNTAPQLKNSFSTIFEGAKNIAQKASTSNIATNTINAMKTNTENLLKMGATYTSPIKEGASTLIQKVGNVSVPAPISKGLETVTEGASKVGSTFGKGIGTVAKTTTKLGTKGIPFVGALVSGAMNALEYSSEADAIDKRVASGEITKEEGERQKSNARGEATGGTVGATAGTAIGGALGAIGGPIGIAIGSTIGGVIGEGIGGWLGGWFNEEKPSVEKPKEQPKVAEKPTDVPKPQKTIHEQFVERQEKIKNGEITSIKTEGRGRHKREYVNLMWGDIPKAQYDERVAKEEEIIRKLDMSKNMTDDEIRATAKRNVFNNTDMGRTFDWDKKRLQEIASIDEKHLKEYNERERIEHEKNGYDALGAYEDVTVEDIKNAKEALKTFDSKENLQKMYSEQENSRKHLKDGTKRDTVYRTYKDGNVVGETVLKNGEIVSNFDESKQYGNNAEGFDFHYDENIDRRKYFNDLLNPTTVAKPTETPKRREDEAERKEAKRKNGNKLNPPPVSQTSEVSVVNTADKVNASSDATTINKPSDIGVPPRNDGLVMQNNAEQIKQQEKDASKEMKVEVVNNNVQNINQTNDRRDTMYSRNIDPSYVRTVDERHGIMG